MWITTKYGFFSIVRAHAPRRKGRTPKPHPSTMMIRARCRDHLVALRAAYPEIFRGRFIKATEDTDYPFRVFVDHALVVVLMGDLAMEIDYINFKDKVHETRPDDTPYHRFLMDTWGRGLAMGPRPRPRGRWPMLAERPPC